MKQQLNVRISPAVIERLQRYAWAFRAALGGIVEAALVDYLDARADARGAPVSSRSPLPQRLQLRRVGRPRKCARPWDGVLAQRAGAMRRRAGRRTRLERGLAKREPTA